MEPDLRVEAFLGPAPSVDRVLVSTDFSPGAERALAWAVHLAQPFGASVDVLHVMGHGDTDAGSPMRLAVDESPPPDEPARGVEGQLQQLIGRHADTDVELRPLIEHGRAVAPAIAEAARVREVDLVVIGTHGRRGMRRLMLGSVAEEVVQTADRPVLVVPPAAHEPRPALSRILMPIDFSAFSLGALPWARVLSEAFGAELVVLHVIESYSLAEVYGLEAVLVAGAHPSMKSLAHEVADGLERDLGSAGLDASVHLDEGHAAKTIPQFAQTYGADLMVMASHGRTGLQRLVLGSVSTRVLRSAPCPILVVRAGMGGTRTES